MRRVLPWVAVWAVPGLLAVGQFYVLDLVRGDAGGALPRILADFLPWQVWAAATPAVLALARRFPVHRPGGWRSVPVHLAASAGIALAFTLATFFGGRVAGYDPFVESAVAELVPLLWIKGAMFQSLVYWSVVGVDVGLAWQRGLRQAELERAQLRARLVEAQLDALRAQLRPHFLFNTLNAASVLVRKGEREDAIRVISGLADLLRRSLSTMSAERVPVREELDFLRRYVDLETVRFSDRLTVVVDADPAADPLAVPSMLLQPLVENALRHGIAPRVGGGRVDIRIHRVDDRLHIEVQDDGAGLDPGHREGIGLSHVRKRLDQLYPGDHRFEVAPVPGGGTRAAVELPAEPA